MSNTHIESMVAVVSVKDYPQALKWYTQLLGREADIFPDAGVAEWQLAEKSWIQVTADPERAGYSTVIIGVRAIDTQRSYCEAAGLPVGELIEVPGVIKMAEIIDPEGNKVAYVQDISAEVKN